MKFEFADSEDKKYNIFISYRKRKSYILLVIQTKILYANGLVGTRSNSRTFEICGNNIMWDKSDIYLRSIVGFDASDNVINYGNKLVKNIAFI